jgi:hypothetical protein
MLLLMLSVVMLSVVYAECYYVECRGAAKLANTYKFFQDS